MPVATWSDSSWPAHRVSAGSRVPGSHGRRSSLEEHRGSRWPPTSTSCPACNAEPPTPSPVSSSFHRIHAVEAPVEAPKREEALPTGEGLSPGLTWWRGAELNRRPSGYEIADQPVSPYQRVPECALDLGFLRSEYIRSASPYTPVPSRTVEGMVETLGGSGRHERSCVRASAPSRQCRVRGLERLLKRRPSGSWSAAVLLVMPVLVVSGFGGAIVAVRSSRPGCCGGLGWWR